MTQKHLRNLVKLTRRIERLNLGSVLKSVLSGKEFHTLTRRSLKGGPHMHDTFRFYTVCIHSVSTFSLTLFEGLTTSLNFVLS